MSETDQMNGDVPNEDEGNSTPVQSVGIETPNSSVSSEVMNASTTPVEETYNSSTVPEVKVGVLPATPDVKDEVSTAIPKVQNEKNVNSTVTSFEKNANPADVPTNKSVNTVSSQRKPKLNRRGFYLANNPPVELSDKKPDQQKVDINGSNDAVETKKIDSSKRIISLTTTKSSTGNSSDKITPSKGKIISLKKTNSFSAEKREKDVEKQPSSSTEPPPKKKHKPITWP